MRDCKITREFNCNESPPCETIKTKTPQHKNILSLLFVFYAAFVPQFRNTSVAVSTLDADDSATARTVFALDDPVRS